MNVTQQLLALLERAAPSLAPRRVRAVHIPPLAAADALAGEFCALELENGAIGLAYVLLDGVLAQLTAEKPALARLQGADALVLARDALDPSPVKRTLGYAAINALTRRLLDRAGYVPPASGDSIGELAPTRGDHVGMIGYFGRLIPRVTATGAQLTVVELRADLAGPRDGYRVTLDRAELAGCNKILSTSTLLLNDTLDPMLAACAAARRFVIVGPGAGCLPDPLFERGVTSLGCTWVDETAAFVRMLVAGESWASHAHKVVLRREEYPGFDVLLARAQRSGWTRG